MMTATATTWPSAAVFNRAERTLAKACNLLDEIHLTCYRFGEAETADEAPVPTLEDLGRLARFIDCVELDFETMKSHLVEVRPARHVASTRIEVADDAR